MPKKRLVCLLMIALFAALCCMPALALARDSKSNADAMIEITKEYDDSAETDTAPQYSLKVDLAKQVVYAYGKDSKGNFTKLVRKMICSTGKEDTPTSSGTFKTGTRARWIRYTKYGTYAQYMTRISSSSMFVSIFYDKEDDRTLVKSSFNALGQKVTTGSIRLTAADARWICENSIEGTAVQIVKGR